MHNGPGGTPVQPPAQPPPTGSRIVRTRSARGSDAQLGRLACGLVIGGVLGGLLWIWQSEQHVQGGTLTVAGAMFAAALARLLLPEQAVRLLSSRRRLVDAAAFGTLGLALLIAGLIVPVPS